MKIGLIVGSLREKSWNRKVAETVQGLFPEGVEAEFIDIKDVPFYNQDLDGDNAPEEYTRLRNKVRDYDGFIFFTPEYNRSYAPAIKNAIDVVSIDPKGSGMAGKPVAVFSSSIGGFGGMAANHALRQVFIYTDLIPMQFPEVYLSHVHELFNKDGEMVEDTKNFLKDSVASFVEHAKMVNGK